MKVETLFLDHSPSAEDSVIASATVMLCAAAETIRTLRERVAALEAEIARLRTQHEPSGRPKPTLTLLPPANTV